MKTTMTMWAKLGALAATLAACGGPVTAPPQEGTTGAVSIGFSSGTSSGADSSGGASATEGSSSGGVSTTGGSSGGISASCTIDGHTYQIAEGNPADSCQLCNPDVSATAWSSVGDGASCAGGFCEQGACENGCLVDGGFFASNASDPSNACQVCDPAASNASFSPASGVVACAANGGDYCVAGSCASECLVGGELYAASAVDPVNECQSCQPGASESTFSNLPDGTACTADGGDFCKSGSCGLYCDIGGALATPGFLNAANPNECCNTSLSTQAWTPGFGSALDSTPASQAQPCIGDVTGDGIPDLVLPAMGQVQILVGVGDGTFTTGPLVSTPSGGGLVCALADFDGNGTLDIALTSYYADEITIMLNQGGNGFTYKSTTFPAQYSSVIAVADLQAPGSRDLVVAGRSGTTLGTVQAYLNQSKTGSFAAGGSVVLQGTSLPNGLLSGTFNPSVSGEQLASVDETGHVNFITSTNGGQTLTVAASVNLDSLFGGQTLDGPISLAAPDFNGDGLADLALSNGDFFYPLINLGGWKFAFGGEWAVVGSAASLAIGDFNGDGLPDVAVVSSTRDAADVFINETPTASTVPTFALAAPYPTGSAPSFVATADFNGDGRLDLLTVNASNWSVFLGQCP